MRFRDGEEEAVAAVRFVPLVSEDEVIREFSAGGVVVRQHAGAAVRRRGARARRRSWRCPRATRTATSRRREAARREVREETGLEAELVEKLGDVRYWYVARRRARA